MIQSLQARPSRRPYLLATLAALLWTGALAAAVAAIHGGAEAGFSATLGSLGTARLALIAAAALGPVIFFYVTAALVVRAAEMRHVARAMTGVALRLAQPETVASDSVVSLSQAVRREVAAMGDGVERALARAGELETLVRTEIATLERAYSDNEIRIRSLVDELVAQRESILSTAERVRGAITGAQTSLTQDLDSVGKTIVDLLARTGRTSPRRWAARARKSLPRSAAPATA